MVSTPPQTGNEAESNQVAKAKVIWLGQKVGTDWSFLWHSTKWGCSCGCGFNLWPGDFHMLQGWPPRKVGAGLLGVGVFPSAP